MQARLGDTPTLYNQLMLEISAQRLRYHSAKPRQADPHCRQLRIAKAADGVIFASVFSASAPAAQEILVRISAPVNEELSAWVTELREQDDYIDITLRFASAETAFQMRMYEQLCLIEQYRRSQQGLRAASFSSQCAANEWIARFSADYP